MLNVECTHNNRLDVAVLMSTSMINEENRNITLNICFLELSEEFRRNSKNDFE